MSSITVLLFSLLACSRTVTSTPTHHKHGFQWSNIKHLITFGDSYTYVQGTLGHQNYSFIGDAFNLPFTPAQLLSDRIVQNQTATAEGGPNWVEYLTGCGLQPGLTAPIDCNIQLWDFAFAGSDISTDFTPLHHNFTVPFEDQISQFVTYGQPALEQVVSKPRALVGVWIGINDISDSDKYNVSFPAFYDTLITRQFSAMEKLYNVGYKNYLVMNLPPLDKTPSNQASKTPLPNITMVGWWNDALAKHASAFQRNNTGSTVLQFDTHAALVDIFDNAAQYGITNTTGYCASYDQPNINTDPGSYGCLPLSQYFWFNTGHLTSHVHQILAGKLKTWLERQ